MQIDRMTVSEVIVLDKADVIQRQDGSISANPRVGRIGIQLYKGTELGRKDLAVVRVYRPESEVMDKGAMASVTHRPVTNDHPPEPVTADNWKKYAVGHSGDTVARDGDFIRVPMMLSDGGVIKDFYDGKKQLSLGYTSNLEWRTGTTDQGEPYDAVQTLIRVNHIAVVDAARGGPRLSIGDSASIEPETVEFAARMIADGKFDKTNAFAMQGAIAVTSLCDGDVATIAKYAFVRDGVVYRKALESIKAQAVADQLPSVVEAAGKLLDLMDAHKGKRKMTEKTLTHIMVGDVSCEVTDLSAPTILRRLQSMAQESGDLANKFATSEAAKKKAEEEAAAAKDASMGFKKKMEEDAATIITLQKQLADAAITPQKLDALVAERGVVIAKGRALLGDVLVIDGKTNSEMRKQVVTVKLGDAAKDWNDDMVAASFSTLTAGVKVDATKVTDQMRQSFNGAPVDVTDGDKAYSGYDKRLSDAWRNPGGTATQ